MKHTFFFMFWWAWQGNSGASTVTQLQYKRGQRYKCTRPCRRMLKWLGEKAGTECDHTGIMRRFPAATARSRTTARTSTTSGTCTAGSRASLASGLTTRHSQRTTQYRPPSSPIFLDFSRFPPNFWPCFPPLFETLTISEKWVKNEIKGL